jgi:hypothetical protein
MKSANTNRARRYRGRFRQRGALYLETIIVLPIIVHFGLVMWQLVDAMNASYLVRHAALAAARAAAVIGPDESQYYGGQSKHDLSGGQRLADIEEAVKRIVEANNHFKNLGNYSVNISGATSAGSMITATVEAEYDCLIPALNVACLGSRTRKFTSTAEFPYQDATVDWEK